MAIINGKVKSSNIAMAMLAGIVALSLALWVFNLLILSVAPNFYTCNNATHVLNESMITADGMVSTITCDDGAGNYSNTTRGFFGTSIVFINDLLPVIGILGAFGILWFGLRKMKIF